MEKRRKALGLKKSNDTPEKYTEKTSRRTVTSGASSKTIEDKTNTKGKVSQKTPPIGSVTPKQKTLISHSNVTPLKPESPCSPLQSPGAQIMFPSAIASPEIEVSWDWSCSQVPTDMLPPKGVKRVRESKAKMPVMPTVNLRTRPRPPLQRQITEEENQQRLQYYKNILSLKPESDNGHSSDSANNNLQCVTLDNMKTYTTPKRPTTRLSSSSKKKDGDNSLFDDSANDFMFECSQAIEEKIKSGEIDMGPIVDIRISQVKRSHSPGIDSSSMSKKTCHGRVNLFPENHSSSEVITCSEVGVVDTGQYDSKLPQKATTSKRNNLLHESNSLSDTAVRSCNLGVDETFKQESINNDLRKNSREQVQPDVVTSLTTFQKPLPRNTNCQQLVRPTLPSKPNQSSNNHTLTSQSGSERLLGSGAITNNNCVDKFRKPLINNNKSHSSNQTVGNPKYANNSVRNQEDLNVKYSSTTNYTEEMQRTKFNGTLIDKSHSADIKSLLEDDFDLELSCLDVDSLCQSSQKKQQVEYKSSSAAKLCTQQEIEAKRLAALQKLMKKKKR